MFADDLKINHNIGKVDDPKLLQHDVYLMYN
jgi:hypothetical protein